MSSTQRDWSEIRYLPQEGEFWDESNMGFIFSALKVPCVKELSDVQINIPTYKYPSRMIKASGEPVWSRGFVRVYSKDCLADFFSIRNIH